MSDVIINAKVGVSGINNGSIVVFARETGEYLKYNSAINQYVNSGTLYDLYNTRFDEHYGGGPESTTGGGAGSTGLTNTELRSSPVLVTPVMVSGGNVSISASGSNWSAFGSQNLKQLTVSNQTTTSLEFRQNGSGVGFQIPNGAFYTFFGISNANQIEARRVDTANTPVTVTARWES